MCLLETFKAQKSKISFSNFTQNHTYKSSTNQLTDRFSVRVRRPKTRSTPSRLVHDGPLQRSQFHLQRQMRPDLDYRRMIWSDRAERSVQCPKNFSFFKFQNFFKLTLSGRLVNSADNWEAFLTNSLLILLLGKLVTIWTIGIFVVKVEAEMS